MMRRVLWAVLLSVVGVENPIVVIETNVGNITLELFAKQSPLAVENFLEYAEDGFYEGTIFHRVVKGSLIQGGGFTPGYQQKKPREPIQNEAQRNRLKNEPGTVALARSGGIHSATSQFFINTGVNRQFDHRGMSVNEFGYTVFGKVVGGDDVVAMIENIKTTKRNGMRDVPTIPIIIKTVRIVSSP